MKKDPFLSSMIMLKPPEMVYNAATAKQTQAARRQQSTTLDGVKVKDAYRQREQGMRSGA